MKIKKYLDKLVSIGRHSFTLKELEGGLGISKASIAVSLNRLKKAGEIVSLARGYYIIIPLEYRSLGCLPAAQFIPDLMKHLDIPYYVCLLSAGEFYGAAHQRPQVFQVMIPYIRKNLDVGKIRVRFYMNKYLEQCPVRQLNTERGYLKVSTPEATALDLVAYPGPSAGFSNVLTVLEELVESLDLDAFREALKTKRKIPNLQRLGYLLELLNEEKFAGALEERLKGCYPDKAMLEPRSPSRVGEYSKRWKLIINEEIESDL
ncbi:MAG: putative transcriptional regulator of viral defense system [Chlamydiales bacterium]|jgi:predicted transcriptional regulator of viral defense system